MASSSSSSTTDKRSLFDRLALGCITHLESFPECRTITFQGNDGAQSLDFLSWERKNSPFKLPAELKSFYSIFNGFNLSWTVDLGGDRAETVGEMKLNRVENILKNTSDFFVQERLPDEIIPPVPKTCTLFSIDSGCALGEIVLLYRASNSSPVGSGSGAGSGAGVFEDPEVWLLDQSCQLTYIARTFTHYMRLLVTHLGIKGWQGTFMDNGWPPSTQLWMNLFCKERLVVDRHYRSDLFHEKRI